MSLVESDIVLPRVTHGFFQEGASDSLKRLPVYIACTVLALITNYVLGKDVAWDTLNYQFYAGFSAVNNRFAQDYFAAGAPSYFNPYIYVPFYALVKADFSPLAISSVLAVVHSAILWLTFELALCVCPSDDRRTRMIYGVCGVALALANPILLQQLGSSFADIATAELVVAGWLLLAQGARSPHTAKTILAGLLLGAACALKLTNSVHAIAAYVLVMMLPRTVSGRIRNTLIYSLALGIGFAAVTAPWSYQLARMFGNPMFPLMNSVFRSPEFTMEPLRHFRFIPDSFLNFLWRPFAIADPAPMIQEELASPDLRYGVLVVLASVTIARALWKRVAQSKSKSVSSGCSAGERALNAIGCGLALDWVLWLIASGNGRYFLAMTSITAVVIVALMFRVFPRQPKARAYLLFAVLGTQLTQLAIGATFRWNPSAWTRRWLDVEVPERLANEPNLYMTIGAQSNSFIAAFLAPGSGFINFSGGYALPADGPSGARIQSLIKRYSPNVRVLWRDSGKAFRDPQHKPDFSIAADALARFGMRVDANDCARITIRGLAPDPVPRYASAKPIPPGVPAEADPDTSYLASCRIMTDGADRSADIAREHAADTVLNRIEDACPDLFQPRRMSTEHYGGGWRRLYLNTDLVVVISYGSVKLTNTFRGGPMLNLGRESDWSNASLPLSCWHRDGRYFATVLQSNKPG